MLGDSGGTSVTTKVEDEMSKKLNDLKRFTRKIQVALNASIIADKKRCENLIDVIDGKESTFKITSSDWESKYRKSHYQVQCKKCGKWHIWIRK